ncbi:PA-phosphatase [Marivirga sp. S37H4]|uniref:PA-phosphatase n=1 Tax=Marivirga aurantiaca TaxID=2802615 RepID=A0A934WXD6_9BACT|nr:PA-phosphatase [Marivirga aurantiaca]MBK6264677.1 PA-phosphatase [Marivirga aurantiaca]
MPSYIFLGILFFIPYSLGFQPDLSWRFMVMVLMTTFLIPLMGVLLLNFTKNISNLNMEIRRERFIPFFFNSLFYMATTYLFWEKFRFPPLVNYVMVSITFSIVLLTIITLFWKISAHAIAVSGATGIYFALLFQTESSNLYMGLALCFALCGLVASARLKLLVHSVSQVWAGLALGFLINFLTILILNR